ncbi:cytochrome oxidase maturation protein, cbb3-type [Alteromonadaceae bacterium Bs31]|nr:cytochrome oxidase maturation protein, cbb3-type [Alteromonadaceae bacterium Bs31]
MQSLLILIPLALIIVAIAVAIFLWAVKSGQYDDLDTEARRILFDEQKPQAEKQKNKAKNKVKNDGE